MDHAHSASDGDRPPRLAVKGVSRTALAAALARAAHQVVDRAEILRDTLALEFAGVTASAFDDLDRVDVLFPPEARLFVAARQRIAEDALAARSPTTQVVILGAGLDTLGYRAAQRGRRVFELDHPVTQRWKLDRFAAAERPLPPDLRLVPIDFEQDTLADALARAGFDRTAPAFFTWLGVVPYLTIDTVVDTLRFVAEQRAPVDIVLDYSEPLHVLPEDRRTRMRELMTFLEGLGEPWLTLLTRRHMAEILRACGFDTIQDAAHTDLLRKYSTTYTGENYDSHVVVASRSKRPLEHTANVGDHSRTEP
ncbi:class I SAM-dependent methyltransferase [Nocardia pseudobrasiliensis]|uniref:S-adenosyl-L-methionine-dependent methyltransferase n=1 Tax=Nocardia pseudobrasiliensis TaxID=45979 RepID=A0A370I6Y1_9NOCA|nr:SAM-dependent methyltransferase [Nocardia pseudobrasiliensis]RDI66469.1 methyltransferase (TIGR00027 family) [Nocardia pseudobrasiliensis]